MCGKLRRPDFDGETEFLKALEEAVGELGFVPAVKVVGAEVPVVEVVFEHVIGRDEHRRGDGEDGFLGASTALEAEELGSEVRVLGAGGGPGGLHEGGLQPGIAGAGAGGETLAGTLVEAGAEAGPGDEMAGGGEAGHIEADLGDQDAGDGLTHARHRDQSVEGGAKRDEGVAEPLLHGVHGLLQGVHLGEMELEQEAVVSGKAAVQGGDEVSARALRRP